jgi:hypothetical protein
MAHVPDHNDPTVHESTIKVFRQKYYIVDDENETGYRTSYELHDQRVEVLADSDGVFIESKEGSVTEVVSIATPEIAVKVARHILEIYEDLATPAPMELDESDVCMVKFLTPEIQARVGHELWRLENHCRSPHGPVDANGAYELLNHIDAISKYLDIEIKPGPQAS